MEVKVIMMRAVQGQSSHNTTSLILYAQKFLPGATLQAIFLEQRLDTDPLCRVYVHMFTITQFHGAYTQDTTRYLCITALFWWHIKMVKASVSVSNRNPQTIVNLVYYTQLSRLNRTVLKLYFYTIQDTTDTCPSRVFCHYVG